jgi:hypothetical protein
MKWRPEYGRQFGVAVTDMGDLYPQQVAEMDEMLAEMRRQARQ